MVIPISWHEQCSWENDICYEQGYAAGYAQAESDLTRWARDARIGCPTLPTRDAVIRWLVRTHGRRPD